MGPTGLAAEEWRAGGVPRYVVNIAREHVLEVLKMIDGCLFLRADFPQAFISAVQVATCLNVGRS